MLGAAVGNGDWRRQLLEETDARLQEQMTTRLASLLNGTRSLACAEEVALSFEAFMSGHLTETLLPFESPFVQNQCPPEPPADLMEEPAFKPAGEQRLLYVILAHKDFAQVVRMIKALQETDGEEEDGEEGGAAAGTAGKGKAKAPPIMSHFVVHVDGKVSLDDDGADAHADADAAAAPVGVGVRVLREYAASVPNVYVMEEARVNVTWGGFSVVQATLNAMAYGFYLGLPFDRVINLSGATYPLATPRAIRAALARHPVHEQLMFVDPTPTVPLPRVWHYFVECDNAMHRVARFVLPRGVPLRTGSQWFIISRAFAHYLLTDDALVAPYTAYAQHLLIPDESFFPTVLMASPFCHFHANTNYLHLTFDVWEDEKGAAADRSKCLQPDPGFCGRSPKLVEVDEVPEILAMAGMAGGDSETNNATAAATVTALFARKFESGRSEAALAAIDARLAAARREEAQAGAAGAVAAVTTTCGAGAEGVGCGGGQGEAVPPQEPQSGGEGVLAKHGISLETMMW